MTVDLPAEGPRDVPDTETDAVMAACRVLIAVAAQSIAAVEQVVDMSQFRVLVVVAGRSPVSLGGVAKDAGIHLSTASRICDRMVGEGLLNRTEDPADRRQVTLTLTAAGRRAVETVADGRRAAIQPVLARMPARARAELVSALGEFVAAAGQLPDSVWWALGWTT